MTNQLKWLLLLVGLGLSLTGVAFRETRTPRFRIAERWFLSENSKDWYRIDEQTGVPIGLIMPLNLPFFGCVGFSIETKPYGIDSNLHWQGFTLDLQSAKVLGELKIQYYKHQQIARACSHC